MATWIIVNRATLAVLSNYESDQKDDSSANRSQLHAEPKAKHVLLPEGADKDCLEGYMAQASAEYEGVTFTADGNTEAGNDIILSFDGVQDIEDAVAEWNTQNPSNTVSHDGNNTDVLGPGAIQLSKGGVQVRETQALVDAKLKGERDFKLVMLRGERAKKLEVADNEIKKHQDSDPNAIDTEANWKLHRIALRDITDPYKDSENSNEGTAALDAYAEDMSDFDNWPTEPSE